MRIQRAAPVNEWLAKLIFLALPSAVVSYFLLQQINEYYSVLQNQALMQSLYFAAGMGGAAVLYAFRFRFLPTFLALLALVYVGYQGLDQYETGEFDAFFIARQFQVAAFLVACGWIMGWGWIRLRYWAVGVSVATLCACVLVIAKSNAETVWGLLSAFVPALLYCIYIVFTAEQIYNYKDKTGKFWWFMIRRLVLFLLLAVTSLGSVLLWQKDEIKATVANYGGGGKAGKNSMLKKNKDNTFDLNDYSRLSSSLGRSTELLFCAHIDNYFPGTDMPNPLYLTAFYFTKFDTSTETFERDSTIPFDDLFQPDPSKIPLFKTDYDSSVIKNSLGPKFRHEVEVEIYSKTLSPHTYLAPNVGYFVQPITIEKDFRDQFKSAFRAKSYVSALNSAYFIYNVEQPEIKKFQEIRFAELRKVKGYDSVDKKFMDYYTFMPSNPKFGSISALAHSITDSAETPVDKVLKIRDYFLARDEHGKRIYQYTDNPGIPDLPNASKLMYFLNENHKGYCAYYAGATLFMLRALGIPSRIAVGFLTEDRSDKNKGWYWYYANQAHAWVQVYFPGYGWLDFDTTVGNDGENRSTPQPDGTPPMQPPKAWFAAQGEVVDVDTLKKLVKMKVKEFVFHDKDYKPAKPVVLEMDAEIATIYRDSVAIPLSAVRAGDDGAAVSYSEQMKRLSVPTSENENAVVKRFPDVIPIDEVYLKRKDLATKKEKRAAPVKPEPVPLSVVAGIAALMLLGLALIVLMLPRVVLWYYLARHKWAGNYKTRAYWAFRAATYYLHMCGMTRGMLTPMQYAREVVDPAIGTSMELFMVAYLKQKYAKTELTSDEQAVVKGFLLVFLKAARKHLRRSARVLGFLNPVRCVSFFVMPEIDA